MKISINWLKEYVNFKSKPEKLVDDLIMSGTEVEILKSNDKVYDQVIVGEVVEIKKHPNADRLEIAKVNIGEKKITIVVGLPHNLSVGVKVPVVLGGTVLPGGTEAKVLDIRGVISEGMFRSEKELGISEHDSSIMTLNPNTPIGISLKKALESKESTLEAEITPNRGDCLSIIGVAREVAAIEESPRLRSGQAKIKESDEKAGDYVKVEVKDKDLCPRYMARVIKDVKVGPSPEWMQQRLSQCGIRPINNVVDVTNYIMLEWGQPLHAFDFEKIESVKLKTQNSKLKTVFVRKARKGEKIETLDGIKRELTSNDLVIADSQKPIAIAGVMGGANSEVSFNTQTIILESACFDKTSVRKTAQKLGVRTEAVLRFEKGIPLSLQEVAIDQTAQLIQEICKGKVLSGRVDVLSQWIWVQHVGLRLSKIKKFLGIEIPKKEIINILKSLGFEAEKFDIVKEAKKHLGKPYKYGANFKNDGTDAFDCSYFVDYLYSLIGIDIGHTAIDQFDKGISVKEKDLKPGDILFYIGHHPRKSKKYPGGVGHCGLSIGAGKVIDCVKFEYDKAKNEYLEKGHQTVHEQSMEVFTKSHDYLGAHRYAENLDDYLTVTVPWWRLDVSIEEDLMEEIARIYGYNKFPSTLPSGELPQFKENKGLMLEGETREILKGAGFSEVYSYSFISKELLKSIGGEPKNTYKIQNPLSENQEYMRLSLIPSLLEVVAKNQEVKENFKIFELAKVYPQKKPENKKLSGAILGKETRLEHFYQKDSGFYSLKGVLELLADNWNLDLNFKTSNLNYLVPQKQAALIIDNKIVGFSGMVHPEVLRKFDIKKDVAVFDINFDLLTSLIKKGKKYQPIPRFPAIQRDLSFLLEKKLIAKDILNIIQDFHPLIKNVEIIDFYEGKELEDKKSLTFRITCQSAEKTLVQEEVEKIQEDLIKSLEKRFKAVIRK